MGIPHHIMGKPAFQQTLSSLIRAVDSQDEDLINQIQSDALLFLGRYQLFNETSERIIFDPQGRLLLSTSLTPLINNVMHTNYAPFIRALGGKASLIHLNGQAKTQSLALAMPILNSQKQVIAVSIETISADSSVYTDMRIYAFGETGETIVIDKEGQILSKTRFSDLAENKQDYQQTLKSSLNDSFKFGQSGQHGNLIISNQDVFSVVDWNPRYGLGFVAKIDSDEVFGSFFELRRGVYMVVALMTLFSVPFTLFTLYVGRKSNRHVIASRQEIIKKLGHAAEFKDNDTAKHIARISLYADVLANALSASDAWRSLLVDASPMHDIGKIGVPDRILNKPGKLDDAEWQIMKMHPQYGADIIGESQSSLLNMAREIALYHHEKWDGSGYPHGLGGERIPLSARIVAVADVFDALTCERVYKKPWPMDKAIQLIRDESGKHFDPTVVEAFERSIPEFKRIKTEYADQFEPTEA